MDVYVLNKEFGYGTLYGAECVGVFDTEEKAQKAMEWEIEKTEKKWAERYENFVSTKNIDTTIGIGVATISTEDRYKHYLVSEKEVK